MSPLCRLLPAQKGTTHLLSNRDSNNHARRAGVATITVALTFLSAGAARADDPEIDSLRTRVERAETEQRLREREAAVKERRREALEAPARVAHEPTRFSRRGRLVFSELTGLSSYAPIVVIGGIGGVGAIGALGGGGTGLSGLLTFGSTTSDYGVARAKSQFLAVSPSVDYFVGEHLTLGVSATAARSSGTSPALSAVASADGGIAVSSLGESVWTSYSLGATPRIGRPIDVGPVTLWPKLGVGYAVTRSESSGPNGLPGQSALARTFATELTFDALFRLGEYVTFSLGPTAYYRRTDRSASERTSAVYALQPDHESVGLGFRGHLGITLP
jgi:hypothetical protein